LKLFRSLLLLALTLTTLAAASTAQARVVTEAASFNVADFRGLEKVDATCSGANPSFLCDLDGATLTRIAGKGVDYFFTPAGELAAAFAKQQRGQKLNNYNIDNQLNLIPFDSAIPGLALLVDGAYVAPSEAEGTWSRNGDGLLVGDFDATYQSQAGSFDLRRRVTLRSGSDAFDLELTVTRLSDGADVELQVATPGIGRVASPTVKVGYDDTFTLNPAEQVIQRPTYISLQQNDNNRGYAMVQLPEAGNSQMAATFMRPNRVAFQRQLGGAQGSSAQFDIDIYAGHNELVRYHQEGYLELPGLFRPNILGRLSLLIVRLLEFIHQYVPNWGLSIIVLTLMFRAVVWPLITTQTKSMFGMQRLQPKLQELQRKYKDDREKLTQETMALYREAGVNPAGGCLPILLQMPLFIILWRVFVNFEFNEGFLWLPDLGQSDPFYILPVLYVLVMLATSYFSARGNPQMLRQSMIINVVFVFIIINFPAGVLVYYVVSMLVQVFQYWLLSRGQPAPALAGAGAPVRSAKPRSVTPKADKPKDAPTGDKPKNDKRRK
jgi:YidC/Oxa1 family membrane protein insertase